MKLFHHSADNKQIWYSFLLNMALVILLFFSSVFAGLYLSNQRLIEQELQSRARAFFQSIVTTRSWNARHGGVYVEKVPGILSNPYLKNPDITSTDGKTYTKKNPALMTREISEMAHGQGYFEFHITSTKPLNPGNAADARETQALMLFEQGRKEEFSKQSENGHTDFWYMAPLYTEQSCLQCHAEQGYRLGDVRGGISVRFNIDQVQQHLNQVRWITIGLFVLSSAVLLVIVYRLIHSLMRKVTAAEQRLREIATTDGLTGLYNRRYLDDRLRNEIERAMRYRYPLSAIMFDIDLFKNINDTYGHDAGDKVLTTIARLAREGSREADIVGRYGGEEFVLVLPNTDGDAALAVAEKLRTAIMATPFCIGQETTINVTASFGVAELPHEEGGEKFDYSRLICAADDALYAAKNAGRNRSVMA